MMKLKDQGAMMKLNLRQRLWRRLFRSLSARDRQRFGVGVRVAHLSVRWALSEPHERLPMLAEVFGSPRSAYWRAFWWAGGLEEGCRFALRLWKEEAPNEFPKHFHNFAVLELMEPTPDDVSRALLSTLTAMRFEIPPWLMEQQR